MTKVLVVFGLKDRFLPAGSGSSIVYGERVGNADVAGYLFEDSEPSRENAPLELARSVVILWQHTSGARNHEAQKAWISRASPLRICHRPTFNHEGKNVELLKKIFVDKDEEVLNALIQEYSADEALDLAENALAWNALANFLEGEEKRKAEKARDAFSKWLYDSGYSKSNYSTMNIDAAWELGLRSVVKEFADMRRESA